MKKKNVGKVVALLLSLVLLLGVAGCQQSGSSSTPESTPQQGSEPELPVSPALKAGTYNVTVTGHNGDVLVEVTLSEEAVVDIQVTDHMESLALGTIGMDKVREQILTNQSLEVDLVAGAIVSAAALRLAVSQAIKEAGGDVNSWNSPVEKDLSLPEDVSCDLVIVGSGSAGMSAAVQASELGINAILIEQLGFLGGSSCRTGYIIGGDTQMQKEQGIAFTTEDMIAQMTKGADGSGNQELYNHEIATQYAIMFGENIHWLHEKGIEFGVIKSDNQFRGPEAARLGSYLISGLQKILDDNSFDYRLNTRGVELIMENGAVAGMKVEDPNGNPYTIHTKNVILATGGYNASKEMCEKYNPEFAGIPYCVSMGADGSGIRMAEAAGGVLKEMDQVSYHPFAAMYNGASRSLATPINSGVIAVNAAGERFCNEKGGTLDVTRAVLAQEGGAFCILDQYLMQYDAILNDIGQSGIPAMYTKADTLEELAAALGIDADGLKATIAQYGESVNNGVDAEFGKSANYLTTDYSEGPYYGVATFPETLTCLGGVVVDANGRVLDKAGEAIPGLYTIGEATSSFVLGSSFNSVNICMGRLSVLDVEKRL